MSILNIREYGTQVTDQGGRVVQVGREPAVAGANKSFTGTSVQSSAFNDETRFVRLMVDAAAYIEFGSDPTAAAGTLYLPSTTPEYFGVNPGDKVAVIEV